MFINWNIDLSVVCANDISYVIVADERKWKKKKIMNHIILWIERHVEFSTLVISEVKKKNLFLGRFISRNVT